jgi:hypothetical protein
MSESFEAALVSLGDQIAYPATPGFEIEPTSVGVRHGLGWKAALAFGAAAVLVLLAFPGPRAAIADFFGIGAVRFIELSEISPAPTTDFPSGDEVSLETASSAVDFPILTLDQSPDLILLNHSIPGGMVTLGYGEFRGSYRLLITQLHARTDEESLGKLLLDETIVQRVDVDGARGFWIEGELHTVVILDRDGDAVVDSARLVGNTLLYVEEGRTVRIEGDLTLDQALNVAASLEER